VTLPKTWDLAEDTLPTSLYVEGISASSSEGDVQLRLRYTSGNTEVDDTVTLTVVKTDLDIDADYNSSITSADDSIEVSAGGRVGLNQDDDDSDGTVDKDQTGAVTGEDDLEEVQLNIDPSVSSGSVKLEAISGSSKIKVWEDSTKTAEVTLPKTWDLAEDTLPSSLYVEGISVSSSEGDVELRLRYTSGNTEVDDMVKLTVVKTDLDIDADYNGSITDADDSIEMSAGGLAILNQDDDDSDGTPDKDQTGSVTGEDDLEEIELSLDPTVSSGTLKLEAVAGGSKIKIWENSTKGTEVTLPKTWTIGTDAVPTSLYVEGVAASSSERDVELRLRYTSGETEADDTIALTLLKVDVEEVSFEAPSGGTNYHELKSDDLSVTYSAPHWVDANGDGDTLDAGDKNYPVAFTRNTKPEIGVKFDLGTGLSGQTIKFKATGPGGIAIPPTDLPSSNRYVTIAPVESTGAFVDTIKHYDSETAGNEFELSWEMQIGSSGWFSVGETKHTLYLTLADPETTLNQETLFTVSCHLSDGESQIPNTLAGVWSEFSDQAVYRVDGTRITYWANNNATCTNTESMIKDGNGQCGAWAEFFIDALAVHGITDAKKIYLTPIYQNAPDSQIYAGGESRGLMLVKDWNFSGGSAPIEFSPFTHLPGEATDQYGSAGQGNGNPPGAFYNHFIVEHGGLYYDPSYGGGVHSSKEAWEDASLDGFSKVYRVLLGGSPDDLRMFKENSSGVETLFIEQ
jgi:hypothetical protein